MPVLYQVLLELWCDGSILIQDFVDGSIANPVELLLLVSELMLVLPIAGLSKASRNRREDHACKRNLVT